MKNKKKKDLFKKISNSVCSMTIILLLSLLAYAIYCNINNKVAFFAERGIITVATGSMEPEINPSDYIMIKKTDAGDIKTGDVITFYSSEPTIKGMLNTHRVVKIENSDGELIFTTKGDANDSEDLYKVSSGEVAGVYVCRLPFLTSIANLFKKSGIFLLLVIIPSVAVLIISVKDVFKKAESAKTEKLIKQEVDRLKKEGLSAEDLKILAKTEIEDNKKKQRE